MLYAMKRHTSGAYSDCAIAAKVYSDALFAHFAKIADQDRHHAQKLYNILLPLNDEPTGHALHVPLSTFRFADSRNTGGDAETTALLCLADGAAAEQAFLKWGSTVVKEYDFEEALSLRGVLEISARRNLEFIELYRAVEEKRFHGQPGEHECTYCGAVGPWTDECPTCTQPFSFLVRKAGYV